MLQDVVYVKSLGDFLLLIRFEDGVEGQINVAGLVDFRGVFAPLQERAFFEQVRVEPDLGTIVWPNGADLDPVVLYSLVTGEPLPDFSPTWASGRG